jgi:hypothetical protein
LVKELYAGMVAGVQYALDKPDKRISDIKSFPLPEPTYPIEYICSNAVQENLCNIDCTEVDPFPFGLSASETVAVKGTGVNPCGDYVKSFKNGNVQYVSVHPGTLFKDICPDECLPPPTKSPSSKAGKKAKGSKRAV